MNSFQDDPYPRSNFRYVRELDEMYYCVYCKNVLQDPCQLQCGHRVCQKCVDPLLHSNDASGKPVLCPSGDEFCSEEKLSRDMVKVEMLLIF